MFKFDFEIEEDAEDLDLPGPSKPTVTPAPTSSNKTISQECFHLTLDDILASLPDTISYSPLYVPGLEDPILRRDLYDARFQLSQNDFYSETQEADGSGKDDKSQKEEIAGEEDQYVDSGTDLIPGLYEGGLKTWEGGVDIVEVLSGTKSGAGEEDGAGRWVQGGKVLEVGCGTALPTAYLLRALLSQPGSQKPQLQRTAFHLQDYNKPVLTLVSLPNLLLAALPFLPAEILHQPDEEVDVEETIPDLKSPGVLAITAEVKTAFKALLDVRGIQLKFTYGHWSGLSKGIEQEGEVYNLVLTAETIYNKDSVDDLISVLRATHGTTCAGATKSVALEDSLEDLNVKEKWEVKPLTDQGTIVLVAAKVLYFGVGGGLQDFLQRVVKGKGWSESVRKWTKGVTREVVRVGWDS